MTSGDANGENKKFALLYDKLDDEFVLRHRDISKVSIEQTFIANADGVNDPIPLELYVDYVDKENRLIVLKSSTLTLDTNPQSNNYETIGSDAAVAVSNKQALVFPNAAQGYASMDIVLYDGVFESEKCTLTESVPRLKVTVQQTAVLTSVPEELYADPPAYFYLPLDKNNNAPIKISSKYYTIEYNDGSYQLSDDKDASGVALAYTLNEESEEKATGSKDITITTEGRNTLSITARKKGYLIGSDSFTLCLYRDIYVDGTYTQEDSDGTKTKPFKTLGVAIDCVNAIPADASGSPITITVKSNCNLYSGENGSATYFNIELKKRDVKIVKDSSVTGNVTIEFDGVGNLVLGSEGNGAKRLNIEGVNLHYGQIRVEGNTIDFTDCTLSDCFLNCYDGVVTLKNCNVLASSSGNTKLHLIYVKQQEEGDNPKLTIEDTTINGFYQTDKKSPAPGVEVQSSSLDAAFIMKGNSKITGFAQSGVYVFAGRFDMEDGTIENNSNNSKDENGGGVRLGTFDVGEDKIIFNMTGGTIKDNYAKRGGGVYVGGNATMYMSGDACIGDISQASAATDAACSNSAQTGAGIFVNVLTASDNSHKMPRLYIGAKLAANGNVVEDTSENPTIAYNYASTQAGAIYVNHQYCAQHTDGELVAVEMYGGAIKNNSSNQGPDAAQICMQSGIFCFKKEVTYIQKIYLNVNRSGGWLMKNVCGIKLDVYFSTPPTIDFDSALYAACGTETNKYKFVYLGDGISMPTYSFTNAGATYKIDNDGCLRP